MIKSATGFTFLGMFMNHFLDSVWQAIEVFIGNTVVFLDTTLSPLEVMGPGFVIFLLAFFIVGVTRLLSRFYVTGRSVRLEKEFRHWHNIRQEAMQHPDREKGKALAKNIDQAQLNKAYYDYFFEGLLKNFITTVLPILLMVAYVTKVYTPQALLARFGDKWIFSVSFGSSFPVAASSLLFFMICLFFWLIFFAITQQVFKKSAVQKNAG